MELIEVIANSHFEDSRIGAVSRKQRLRIGKQLAEHLVSLGLVDYVNPPQAVVYENPKIEPEVVGGDEPSMSLPPERVLPEKTATLFRRGRPKKTSE
jgi:hypothetical protein